MYVPVNFNTLPVDLPVKKVFVDNISSLQSTSEPLIVARVKY